MVPLAEAAEQVVELAHCISSSCVEQRHSGEPVAEAAEQIAEQVAAAEAVAAEVGSGQQSAEA